MKNHLLMSNLIPHRISDFLKAHPPFSQFDKATLTDLSHRVRVVFLNDGEAVDFSSDELQGLCFVIREGAIAVFDQQENLQQLVDKLETGDLFGDEQLFENQHTTWHYKTTEDCLLYGIPLDLLLTVLENHPTLTSFFPGNPNLKLRSSDNAGFFPEGDSPYPDIQTVDHSKQLISCAPQTPVREAALRMRKAGVGSVVVLDDASCPIGIATDKDFRNRVATGDVALDQPVQSIMNSPVICTKTGRSMGDLQLMMIRHNIGHLCITTDGTDRTSAVGMVSEHDLLLRQSNNPAILAKAIRRAASVEVLAEIRGQLDLLAADYLSGKAPIAYIARIVTLLNDMLLNQILKLATEELSKAGLQKPVLDFCWIAIGSQGRGEQILRTDQDNALVYQDPTEAIAESAAQYFHALAEKVVKAQEICGFEACPADMMASNPQWCLPLKDWKRQFSSWILHPTPENILLSNIFFDYRAVAGKKELVDELSVHIRDNIKKQSTFLSFLALEALKNPPPLSFFRNLLLEKSGEHKDQFDIKLRAMLPLADAARLLHLAGSPDHNLSGTTERFQHLATLEPANRDLYLQAAEAYETLMRFRNAAGLANNNSGRYFFPKELSKMEQLMLKNCFQPIRDLQNLINMRFQLSYFR